MNDEIKEIIELINTKYEDYYIDDFLSGEDVKKLVDYITNLQQKVEQYENPDDLTLFYMWLDEKAKDKMKELQQENEQLRTEQNTYINTIKEVNKECNSLFNHLTKKDLNYKSRNEKAIEYIENELFNGKDDLEWRRRNDGTISGSDLPAYYILDLYDILKGDSK